MMIIPILILFLSVPCSPFKLGIATASGLLLDGNFHQLAWIASQQLVQEYGIEVEVALTNYQTEATVPESNAMLQALAENNTDFIVTFTWTMANITQFMASQYPNIKWIIMDWSFSSYTSNLDGVIFAGDQAAYLAGVVVGSVTKTKRIGIVSGIAALVLYQINGGGKQGILSVCPDCLVYLDYTNNFENATLGAESAKRMIDLYGCDGIMGAGGSTGSGGILYASMNQFWGTGVDTDEYFTTFKGQPLNVTKYLLTSWRKRVDIALIQAVQEAMTNTWQSGTKLYNLANNGIALAPCHDSCQFWSAELTTNIAAIESQLASGALQTGIDGNGNFIHSVSAPPDSWVTIYGFNDRPPSLIGHSAVVLNNNDMYIFGGLMSSTEDYNTLYHYDHGYEMWAIVPTIGNINGRSYHSAVIYNDDMYVYGGQIYTSNGQLLVIDNHLWQYSFNNNTWTNISTGPPRYAHGAFVQGDQLYIVGGNNDQQLSVGSSIWTFSFLSNTWTEINAGGTGPPNTLSGFCSAGFGDFFYLFGGKEYSGYDEILQNVLYKLDTKTNTWSTYSLTSTPSARSQCTLIALEDRLVLYGGLSSIFESSVWNFDLRLLEWQEQNAGSDTPLGRLGHSMVYINSSNADRSLIFGGSISGKVDNNLFLYTFSTLVTIQPTQWISCDSKTKFVDYLDTTTLDQENGIFPISYMCDGYVDCKNNWDESWSCLPSLSALWASFAVLMSLGVLLIIVSMVGLVVYWKHPRIVASSRTFLVIILIGGILGSSMMITVAQYRTPQSCGALWWIFGFAFTLVFGTISIKNFRIWRFYRHAKRLKKNIAILTDWHLAIFLAVALSVDVLLLGLWTGIESPFQTKVMPEPSNSLKSHMQCVLSNDNPFLWIFLAYKLAIIAFSAVVAFNTRTVDKKFTESKYIALSVYSYTIMALLVIPLFSLGVSAFSTQVLSMTCIFLAVTIPLVLLYVPKFFEIFYPRVTVSSQTKRTNETVASVK